MSPEMVLSQTSSAASDWWSAGVCLFEMITKSEMPFGTSEDQPADLMMKIAFGEIDFPPNQFSEHAEDLVTRLLAKRPEDRLQDATQIKVLWFCAVQLGCRVQFDS